MSEEKWASLGARLRAADPDYFDALAESLERLTVLCEAQRAALACLGPSPVAGAPSTPVLPIGAH